MSRPSRPHGPCSPTAADLLTERLAGGDPVAFADATTDRVVTWGQVARLADQLESHAGGSRWGGAPIVGLSVRDPLSLAGCLVAALAAGVPVAPLDAHAVPAEILRQTEALGLAALVADGPGAPGHLGGDVPLWRLDGPELGRGAVAPSSDRRPLPTEAAVVLASSGTTGSPKVIPLTEAQLLRTAGAVVTHHRLGPDDRCLCPLPLHHVNGIVVGTLSTLVSGGRLVLQPRFSARSFWDAVERTEPTWLNLVPSILAVLGRNPAPSQTATHQLRVVRSASAPLPAAVRERFEALTGVRVLETYGMTEAASQITANPLDERRRRDGSVGLPVDVELRVVDESGRPVAAGETGRVLIRGERVTRWYWSPGPAARALAATDVDGWLDTGDLGSLDDDGFLRLLGRVDDVINRGGEKIHPREIEELLLEDPSVTGAIVVGVPDPVLGERPVALVVAHGAAERTALGDTLGRRCAERLSRHKRPTEILVVEDLPTGRTGKPRRPDARRLAQAAVLG